MTMTTKATARGMTKSSRSSSLVLVLRHQLGVESGAVAFLDMDEELYKSWCLRGFGRVDEWACIVGRALCEG